MAQAFFTGPALEVVQPIGTFLVAAIPWRVLQDVTYPDPLRLAVDQRFAQRLEEWQHVGRLTGTQRPMEERRLREIARFIETIDATFPNAIILAVPDADSVKGLASDGAEWEVMRSSTETRLVIPANPRLAVVVDGQHRLYAFPRASLEADREFQVICSVFFELPRPMQAMIFATINTNQKPVRRGLAMNLYGYNLEDESRAYWSPEKLSVFLTRRLNFQPDSPLHGLVKVEAEGAPRPELLPGAKRAITMVSVVDGVLGLITSDSRRDRDALKKSNHLFARRATREDLAEDKSPLRDWYRNGRDGDLFELLSVFFRTTKDVLWSREPDVVGMLNRSVGVRALFRVMVRAISAMGPGASEDPEFGGKFDVRWREIAEICARIDFRDDYFEATDRGRRRIELVASHAVGLIPVDQLPPADRDEVVRRAGAAGA